jgi:hypothetical protein
MSDTPHFSLDEFDKCSQDIKNSSNDEQKGKKLKNEIKHENSNQEINEKLNKLKEDYLKLEVTLIDQLENRLTEEVRLAKFHYLKTLYDYYLTKKTLVDSYHDLLIVLRR